MHRHVKNGISLAEIGAYLEEEANYAGIEVQWILGPVRGHGREAGAKFLQDVIALGCESIVGVVLAGRAHFFAPAEFADVFALAWHRGLRLAAHAREMLGPPSVWDALQIPGVQRIGHGVTAVEDQPFVQHLAEQEIPL